MFTIDLLEERNVLRRIQEHHLHMLHAADHPSGILLFHKQGDGFRWLRRELRGGRPVTTSLPKTERVLAGKLAVNLYRLVCVWYIQGRITEIDKLIRKYLSSEMMSMTEDAVSELLSKEETSGRREETAVRREETAVRRKETAGRREETGQLLLADNSIEKLLTGIRNYPRRPADFFDHKSPYMPFILAHLRREYAEVIDWYLGDYVRNNEHPEYLQFPVKLGYNVRSKSEVIAADRLFEEGILFHYEERILMQSGDTSFPDFVIMLSIIERYAWEHYGAMDDDKYYSRTRGKILTYLDNRCLPGINMITTYETKKNPLTVELVDQKIRWLKKRYRVAFADLPPDESFNMYDLAAFAKNCRAVEQ